MIQPGAHPLNAAAEHIPATSRKPAALRSPGTTITCDKLSKTGTQHGCKPVKTATLSRMGAVSLPCRAVIPAVSLQEALYLSIWFFQMDSPSPSLPERTP